MGSDREIAVRREPIEDTREHTLLKGLPEVGEREIAATENEVKEQSGRFVPQVLTKEFNTLPMLRLEAVEGPHSRERILTEVRRQFAQTRRLKACSAGARKHGFVDVGRHN